MIYDPEKQTVECNGKTINFYCGKDFNDTAEILAWLAFGRLSLQDAYIDIMETNTIPINDDIKMFISRQLKKSFENATAKMINDGVLLTGSGCKPPKTGEFHKVQEEEFLNGTSEIKPKGFLSQ